MHKIQLQKGVFTCISNECLVFLDSNKMNYFQLNNTKTRLVLESLKMLEVDGYIDEKASKLINTLVDNHLITFNNQINTKSSLNHSFTSEISLPKESIYPATFINRYDLKLKDFISVFIVNSYVRTKFKIYKTPLKLGKGIFSAKTSNKELSRLIGLYNSALVFTPWRGVNKCLLKSMSLKYFLDFHGFKTDLIIGVKTNPFFAHAWLQIGDLVLNDDIDRVGDYSPIMRIR